jgi:hypothetical protein
MVNRKDFRPNTNYRTLSDKDKQTINKEKKQEYHDGNKTMKINSQKNFI